MGDRPDQLDRDQNGEREQRRSHEPPPEREAVSATAVLGAMAAPAEHLDVGAMLVAKPPVGSVVDSQPAAGAAALALIPGMEDP